MTAAIKNNSKIFLLLILSFSFGSNSALLAQIERKNFAIINPGESIESIIEKAANVVPSKEQYAWQKMEFISFIHFGMNTFTNKEWGDGTDDPKVFNPTRLDTRQWIRILKNAGAKLVILTAKHHDGFCLWPSKFTDYSVKTSLWKNGKGDVVREFVNACNEFGLKVGIYLSPWDRHEKSYGDSPRYNEYFTNLLTELLSNYGKISEVWFDGACGEGPNGKKQIYDWQQYYRVVRKLQPNALIFGMATDIRWVGTETGIGRETEWNVIPIDLTSLNKEEYNSVHPVDLIYNPKDYTENDLGSREKLTTAKGLFWYPAETDVSIRPGWFYHEKEDDKVKTPEELTNIYFNSVGRNGVLLLNVPPNKMGLISSNDEKNLIGFKKNLNAIFKNNLLENSQVKTNLWKKSFKGVFSNKKTISCLQKDNFSVIEFEMVYPKSFNVVMLQEEIQLGQRIEKFRVDYWNDKEWNECARGTTVGFKRLIKFSPVKAKKIRIVVEQSRLNATIKNVGLFSESINNAL